jgi:hypothetical protein
MNWKIVLSDYCLFSVGIFLDTYPMTIYNKHHS